MPFNKIYHPITVSERHYTFHPICTLSGASGWLPKNIVTLFVHFLNIQKPHLIVLYENMVIRSRQDLSVVWVYHKDVLVSMHYARSRELLFLQTDTHHLNILLPTVPAIKTGIQGIALKTSWIAIFF